jgi:hypothetical protein
MLLGAQLEERVDEYYYLILGEGLSNFGPARNQLKTANE